MNNLLQSSRCVFLLLISLFYLLTDVNASPPGEIIFVHPSNDEEIWISNSEGTTARKLFRSTFYEITSLEVQRDGDFVIAVADQVIERQRIAQNVQRLTLDDDVFLFDRDHPDKSARNLTQGRYDGILYADITDKGDVIFLTVFGLYHIESDQVLRRKPEVKHILDINVYSTEYVDLSPNGSQIAYLSRNGLYVLNIDTQEIIPINQNATYSPITFSNDGKQIAFSMDVRKDGERLGAGIAIAPVQPNPEVEILLFKENYQYSVQGWSPDGEYIAYSSYLNPKLVNTIELFRSIRNFVMPTSGGEPEPILITIKENVDLLDWDVRTYAVEPNNSLVTTWGKLKEK